VINRKLTYQNFYLLKEVSLKKGFGVEKKCCRYTYDALNRITSATDNTGHYNLTSVSYDKNGNIKTLDRKGDINTSATLFGNMDLLKYYYQPNSNKLKKVLDTSGKIQGFKDGANVATEYTYDQNGNMKTDANKGITSILYNHLNLPTEIKFNNSNTKKINYTYDAIGTKLRKVVNDNGSITTTDYAGNYVYENNDLQFFSHAEGYVKAIISQAKVYPQQYASFDYVYQYKDHLGNVRLSYSDSDNNGTISQSEIIEENNYYPFGLKHKGYNSVITSTNPAQDYKYNGKELNDELWLNTYDFGARNYNPALGRWMNIDPLSARYDSNSPYNFTINNPIYFVDPDGKRIIIYYQSGGKTKQYEYNYEEDRDTEGLPEFLANAITALDGLYEASNIEIDGETVNPFDKLIESDKELSVVSGKATTFKAGISQRTKNKIGDREKHSDIGTLYFNDKKGVLFDDVNDTSGKVLKEQLKNNKLPPTAKINSPMSILGHDILHAFNYLTDKKARATRKADRTTRKETPSFGNAEEKYTTTLSIQINRNLGENDRPNYRGTPVPTQGVKSNKIKKNEK